MSGTGAALVRSGHLVIGDADAVRSTAELNAVMELNYCGPNRNWKPDKDAAVASSSSRA